MASDHQTARDRVAGAGVTPPFMSPFAGELERFLAFKRALGFRYGHHEFLLRAFDRFVHVRSRHRRRVTLEALLREWLARNEDRKPISVAFEASVLRQFCVFRRREDPRAFVPARKWTPQSTASGSFLPYVLTDANVRTILRLAASLERPRFRAPLYRTLLLVLYCTGIRFGEALRLRLGDVDLVEGVLFVAESKGRSRWVPFHPSLGRAIERYLVARRAFAGTGLPIVSSSASTTLGCRSAPPTARYARSSVAPGSSPSPAGLVRDRTTFATPSPCIGSSAGIARAPTSMHGFHGSRSTWGTTISSARNVSHRDAALARPRCQPNEASPIGSRGATVRRGADPLLALVESYINEHLRRVRGASPHTVRAYGHALRLFFLFLARRARRSIADLRLDDITVESVLAFLDDLESTRGNGAGTRNCRLAAVRGLVEHLLRHDLSRAKHYQRILSVRAKKARGRTVAYLEPEQVRAILAQPERRTPTGLRDYALLVFLYNTGARVSEALALTSADVHGGALRPRHVRVHGKGNKERICPLWPETSRALTHLVGDDVTSPGPVFRNARGNPLTRDGVAYLLAKYVRLTAKEMPNLLHQRVTPHVLRHS